MATMVLGVAGGLLGPFGAAAGAMIGSYIDQRFLFKKKDADDKGGGRVGSTSIQQVNEGGPVFWTLGSRVRVPATILYLSDLITEQSSESVGGKHGNTKTTTQHYYVNVAMMACGRSVFNIPRIRANGKLVYKAQSGPLEFTSDDFSTEVIGSDETIGLETILRVHSFNGGPDFRTFLGGIDVVVSGFGGGDTANNGTWKLVSTGIIGSVTYVDVGYNDQFTEVSANTYTITLSQTIPDFFASVADDIRIYTGSETQVRDPILTDAFGDDVPAYRGWTVIYIERLALDNFSGVTPQFSIDVETYSAAQTNAEIITDLLTVRANIDPSWYDVSGLATVGQLKDSRGWVIPQPTTPLEDLQPLMLAHFLGATEVNGVLTFYDRGDETTIPVTDGDLAAHSLGGDAPRRIEYSDPDPSTIPRQVNVRYLDSSIAQQPGHVSERAHTDLVTGDHELDIDLPLVMGGTNARKIARRALWDGIAQSERLKVRLPPQYLNISAGDRLSMTDEGETVTMVVTEVDIGADFIIICDGFRDDAQTAIVQDGESDDPAHDPDDDQIGVPGEMVFGILEMPPLDSAHVSTPGYYIAAALADILAPFTSASAFRSNDDVTFAEIATLASEQVIGTAEGNFIGSGPVGYWDQENELNIRLRHGSLGSKTDLEVLNGGNMAYYGGEIIAFATAALEVDGTYTISRLLRGLRGTEGLVDTHGDDEFFVIVSNTPPVFTTVNVSDLGVNRYFRVVAAGGSLDDAFSGVHAAEAGNLKPFSPFRIRGYRDGSNDDVVISWERRTRSSTRFFAFPSVPLDEESEQYVLEIYTDGTYVTLADTYTINAAKTFDYTQDLQTGDGLTPGDPVFVELYQVSATVGRGTGRRGVV